MQFKGVIKITIVKNHIEGINFANKNGCISNSDAKNVNGLNVSFHKVQLWR